MPLPTYAEVSRRVSQLLVSRGEEWAGLPMPIPGLRLTLEPRNPWRERLNLIEEAVHKGESNAPGDVIHVTSLDDEHEASPWTVRNAWFSRRLGVTITILSNGQRVTFGHGAYDYVRRFQFAFDTMRAAAAWTIDTEMTAVEKLSELLEHRAHLWDAYVMTGTFIETSARSGVTYLFRRCRPTVAFRDEHILCTLCLHPVGYYENTHAGSMCPTDDVIAHLLLMRADEPFFWRRCNQHAPWRPESGL